MLFVALKHKIVILDARLDDGSSSEGEDVALGGRGSDGGLRLSRMFGGREAAERKGMRQRKCVG
jgi:hypothetical protein